MLSHYDIFTDTLHFKDTQDLCAVFAHCSHFSEIIYDNIKKQIPFTVPVSVLKPLLQITYHVMFNVKHLF